MAMPDNKQNWPNRYRQLLANSDLCADTVLSKALAPQPVERPALFSLSQCLNKPELLLQQVRADYADVTDKRSLLTCLSVSHLDLVQSIIAPLTLRLFLHGQAPLPDNDRIFFGPVQGGKVMSRWFQTASDKQVGIAEFTEQLAHQLSDWYLVFRHKLGVSPGAYWSNTGLALGAPFTAVWNTADPDSVCALAQEWLAQFACDAHQFIEWISTGAGDRAGAVPQRRGCCLKFQLPKGGYCGTCGVYRKARLAELNRPFPCSEPEQWQPPQPARRH